MISWLYRSDRFSGSVSTRYWLISAGSRRHDSYEVAEYLGDDPRTVLTTYAHVLGEGQRRDFANRLAAAESKSQNRVHSTYTFGPEPAEIIQLADCREFGI
jgi:hypothetical protein